MRLPWSQQVPRALYSLFVNRETEPYEPYSKSKIQNSRFKIQGVSGGGDSHEHGSFHTQDDGAQPGGDKACGLALCVLCGGEIALRPDEQHAVCRAAATVNGTNYEYAYDNIGNRTSSTEGEEVTSYASNALNQYTMIRRSVEDSFLPEFDEDGNQLYIQTETANWALNYNAANRPTDFSCMDEEGNFLTVKCDYDFMGRRVFKKVISGNSTVISHQRFIYRGYLQIACVDLTRTNHPALWLITWNPTQPVATRPLAIQKDGTWYTYGLDLTKNVCEVFGATGYIRTAYTYSPFGSVTATGNVTQPIQWSSEFNDEELGLVYYNWRYFDSLSGKWIERDELWEKVSQNLYSFCNNFPCNKCDVLGLSTIWEKGDVREIVKKSYSLDFPIVKELHLEDHKILSLTGLRLNKTLTSYFYLIVMGSIC